MHMHMHMHIQVARRCSFTEVYIGGDAGYVAVTRTTGEGPVLLALPLGAPGSGAGFEGWRPLKQEDRANYDWMHEMLYEVVLHSKAYAETEWRNAQPWVEPTSAILPGGGSATYGVRLRLAADVESIGSALLAAGSPVVVPLPGPTLHLDMTSARLQLLLPYGLAYEGAAAEPRGCVELGSVEHRSPLGPAGTNLQTVRLAPRLAGRCRVSLRYARGGTGAAGGAAPRRRLTQHVHLMLLPPAAELLRKHGVFASSVGWLGTNATDPWHRAPAFLGTEAGADPGSSRALLSEPRLCASRLHLRDRAAT